MEILRYYWYRLTYPWEVVMKKLMCRLFHEGWHSPVPYPPGSGTVVDGRVQEHGIMRMQCLACGRCWGFYPWERYAGDGYRIPIYFNEKPQIAFALYGMICIFLGSAVVSFATGKIAMGVAEVLVPLFLSPAILYVLAQPGPEANKKPEEGP